MKRTAIVYLMIFLFLSMVSAHVYAWPWDKKEEPKQPAAQATQTVTRQSESDTQIPNTAVAAQPPRPEIRIPRPPPIVIPKITFERPQTAAQGMSLQGPVRPPTSPQEVSAEAMVPPPQDVVPAKFHMESISGELVSVTKKDEKTISLQIKREDGSVVTVDGDPTLSMTRMIPVTELPKGEKISAHCVVDDNKKESRVIMILGGVVNMPSFQPPPEDTQIQKVDKKK